MASQGKKVVIVGGGFAGINAAKGLGNQNGIEVVVVDKRNHHLFQPLLYQVAMAGLSPAEIAAPIRSMLAPYRNVRVIQGEVEAVNPSDHTIDGSFGSLSYDYLILACGAMHHYFGREEWEQYAPGLKTLEQATEIRRRVLSAFEQAETEVDPTEQRKWLTFVIVGGGPTGVELAGAIGEMSRFTLARDFKQIDPALTRVILVEAGPRILPSFSADQSARATRDLERLGVQTWTNSRVTDLDARVVRLGRERIEARTCLWAAGVQASSLGDNMAVTRDGQGRIVVGDDLTIDKHPDLFVLGDMASVRDEQGQLLPGVAPVAMQQGRYAARTIVNDVNGHPRIPFRYRDKGMMATIGRKRAVLQSGRLKLNGFLAWMAWLVVHIYYLTGFKNRMFVVLQWAWSYVSFKKGARLITNRQWRSFGDNPTNSDPTKREAQSERDEVTI